MKKDTTQQSVLFDKVNDKPVIAVFDQPDSSSDGGALLIKSCDQKLGLSDRLNECIKDTRESGKVKHTMSDLLRQRVYALACGYEDCNDATRLVDDPMYRLLLDRDPLEGSPIASQPTLSRFENGVNSRSLVNMSYALVETVIGRHRERVTPRVITIDMDPTDDPTYGHQQMSFFNAHYDNHCYLPMACFVQFDEEPDQYLFAYVLRAGDASASHGAVALLRRTIKQLKEGFKDTVIRVRLDAGFATAEVLDLLDEQGVEYVVAMGKNAVLEAFSEPLMENVRWSSYHSGQTEKGYGECEYEARSWGRERRVIFKAEVLRHGTREPKDNPRFVITNINRVPKNVYEKIYCRRANIENRIKELKYGLHIDRTSCTSLFANQLRALLTAAAYVLLQELRLQATDTLCANAQVSTLQLRLLKIGVWLKRTARRVVMHLPDSSPWITDWCHIARRLGAVSG